MGSYLYLMSETNPKYNFEYKSNWKVLSQGFYGRGPRENSAPYGDYTKSEPDSDKADIYYTSKKYKFKLIWTIGKAWVTIEDTVLQEHNFNGQIESFRHLCMGMSAEAENSAFAHLSGSSLYFTAEVHAADPPILHKIAEADSQSGPILTTLPRPFQVRVTDLYDNPVVNHPVLFQVQSAQGHLNGHRSLSLLTDEMGMAQAILTLGSTPGLYSVSASSVFNGAALSQSPLLVQANAFYFLRF